MASQDVTKLAESLARTQVGGGELSYKGRGLKCDNAESVEELVREIEAFEGLQALRLEGNTFGVQAAQTIAKALGTKSQLECCYWSDMFTGRLRSEIPPALKSLGAALMTAGAHLKVLDLSDNAFGPDGVKGIDTLLRSPACHTLQELRLNNCGMGIGGGKILAAALTECHRQSSEQRSPLSLKVFIAGRNRLENDGAKALAQAFQLMGSLEEVHMPQNGINHAGVTALALAMRHNPQLRVLNLNDNTFTKKGAIAMAQVLGKLRNVQVINFGDCLVRSEGATAIAEALKEGLPILKELNLSYSEITEEAALAVAQAVQHKLQLEKLDLNGNCLGEDGCKAVRKTMDDMSMGDVLGSLSEDEGEPEDDDEDEDEEDDGDDDEVEDEDDKEEDDDEEEDGDEEGIPEKAQLKEKTPSRTGSRVGTSEVHSVGLSPVGPPLPPELVSFLKCPTLQKLMELGKQWKALIEQMDVTDSEKTVEMFLTLSCLYSDDDDEKDAMNAVLESVDTLLRKAFSSSSQSYSFISTLLVRLGLIKSEDKVKAVQLKQSHLLTLKHVVKQNYFPKENIAILQIFMQRPNKALDVFNAAKYALVETLDQLAP